MDVEIKNSGAGPDIGSHVDQNNQLHVFSVDKTVIQDAVSKGLAYNINTGTIGLTSTTASSVLYFKNDEDPINGESGIVIDAVAVGIGDGGTNSEKSIITFVRNPTGGTTVDNANAVDMKQNRNFGSDNTLSTTTLAYKGAEGETTSGGNNFAQFYQLAGTRGYYTVDVELPRGASFGVTIDTQTTSGTTDIYVALILHRKDGYNN